MAIACKQIEAQKKELEKEEAIAQVEQFCYDTGVKETEDNLRAQVTGVCRSYCLQVWTEGLNLAEVGAFLDLRKTGNVFYLSALRIVAPPTSQVTTALKVPSTIQPTGKAPTTTSFTAKAFTVIQLAGVGTT